MVRRNISLARQIVQEILAGIQAGTLARDDGLLPSETELSQRFEVSRATIREALSQLEQRGVVLRRHGVGTFLVPPLPRIDAGLEELESLETLARRSGLETQMGEPVIEERTASPSEARCLEIPPAQVLSVSRVIMTGKRPVAYLVDIVPTTILRQPDIAKDFRGSVLDLLLQRSDLQLSHSRTDILIESADKSIARKLHIKVAEPLHRLDAQLFSRDGRVVAYSVSYFVPGYIRFHVIRRVGQHDGKSS